MEIAALALPAVDRIEKCIRGEIDRYKKFSNISAVVDELYEIVKRLKGQLVLLDRKCKELEPKLSSECDSLFLRLGASTVDEKLKSIHDRLEKESGKSKRTGKVKEMTRRFTKAKSICQMLKECKNDAVVVERDVKEYYKIALEAHQAEASGAKGHDIGAQDCFRASFDVEKNPSHIVLHYGLMSRGGEEDDDATMPPEAHLKRAVLGASDDNEVTATVGCWGMGGFGKSCALRGLAADEDVRRRFPDGVYMIVLGEKASKVDVVKGVSHMVKHSGGRRLAQDMRKEGGDVREVLLQACAWFRSRQILLLVDDVWENGEVNGSIIGQLHRSLVRGQSRLAFTTRRPKVAAEYQTIKFGKRDEVASREILLKAAGASASSTGSFKDVVDGVRELCAGLPLVLAIAGKGIAARFRYSREQSWREAWAEALVSISRRLERVVVNTNDDYHKHSLEAVCTSSLNILEDEKRRRVGFEWIMTMHQMYWSLVIQKKQAAVPADVLRRLWGMDRECDALEAMHMFVEVSLAERRSVALNGKDTVCVSLHDLQHDLVQAESEGRGLDEEHHRKVLDEWWYEEGQSREVRGHARRDWSGSKAFDDDYMRNNLSWHLVGGGLGSELRGLLRNPRWTAKRLRRREALGLEEDFGLAMASVESGDAAEEERGSEVGERWGLEMICGAARLSASFVARNRGDVWFQLRGRLVGLANKSGIIKEFVDEIDRYAERPWARPTWPCLSEPGRRVFGFVQCAGGVTDMRRGEREGEVHVCGLVDGMGFLCSVVNGDIEGEEVFVNKRPGRGRECASPDGDNGVVRSGSNRSVCNGWSGICADESTRVEWSAVESVRYTADGDRVVTRHRNGTVRIWDGASGKAIGGALGGYGEECEFSPCGGRVVCGGEDGCLRISDSASGEAVGGNEHAHGGRVSCVEWSADRSWVVSGGYDGSVKIWDGSSGEAVGGDKRVHGGGVICVEWSADGKRFVSGGGDGSVKISDGASVKAVRGDEPAHDSWVTRLKWSADGGRVVSGGEDGSVRMWNGVSGKAVGGDERAHGAGVWIVEWSADGSRVVSGGLDGSVKIWDGASGEVVGGDERAHSDSVWSVKWSPNGSRVVSGGRDGSVRIWNGISGEAMGGDKRAHSKAVTCIERLAVEGQVLSAGLDGILRIWDVASGGVVGGDGRAHGGKLSCVERSSDGSWFVSGRFGGRVGSCDGGNGEMVGGDEHAHGGVTRRVQSPDGDQVVSSGRDGSMRVRDGVSGEAIGTDLEACQTRPVKRSRSCLGGEPVNVAGLTKVRDYSGEQRTRRTDDEDDAGRCLAFGRSLRLYCGGTEVVLATFEVDHMGMHGAEFRSMKGAVVFGCVENQGVYRVDILR